LSSLFFYASGDHRDLHSFPTRRSSDLGVTLALLLGTMLHSFAVANLLPASVRTLVVDINPAAVAKLTNQQTFQALGLISTTNVLDRKSTRLNSSHLVISYAVFCLKKKT